MISFIGIFVFLVVIGANFWLGLWNNILTPVSYTHLTLPTIYSV